MAQRSSKFVMSSNAAVNARNGEPQQENQPWKIHAAVYCERLPVITPALTEQETKVQNILKEMDFERSLKSDHEVRQIRDAEAAERRKRGEEGPSLTATAVDDEIRWQ